MKVLTGFFKGELDEEALFAKAKDASPMKGTEQKCEAYYYAAMRRLLVAHDPEGARPLFEQCVATNVRKFIEIPSAKLELERMKRAPKAKQGGPERVEAEEKRTKNKEPGLTSGPDRSASLPCSTTW